MIIDTLANKGNINNKELFSNIIKTSIRINTVDGLINAPSIYSPPETVSVCPVV